MIDNECNILSNMSKTEFREFRSLMVEMVLHTDMSMHFSQLKSMKSLVAASNGEKGSLDKQRVLSMLLHSCDVSHPAKMWQLHSQWTTRCMEEFFKQGDKEQEQGLDFSPLCDRQNTLVPQSQIGFIDFIVSPTLALCGDMVALVVGDEAEVPRPWTESLAINRGLWQERADAGERGLPALTSEIEEENANGQNSPE